MILIDMPYFYVLIAGNFIGWPGSLPKLHNNMPDPSPTTHKISSFGWLVLFHPRSPGNLLLSPWA